ncbi:hypothetical protein O3M35_008929 [Rhynocoris fuscipes]|uniref:WD repeat-containing and planar cell polarity effector protein fritz n=1 Tax=Rhynocoris fuscipes TaxID=488301 RepID=A0AAW1D8M1_9HEMI
MFTLLHEIHFWTLKDSVSISDTDFGGFVYTEKKNPSRCLLLEGKKSYVEKKGNLYIPSNKRPKKLKDSLKELEELLDTSRILSFKWKNVSCIHIILSSGLQIAIKINLFNGDVDEIIFDKFIIGKLFSQYVCDVSITRVNAIFTYTDNQVTLVYFSKPSLKCQNFKKWSLLEPKVQSLELSGPAGRRLDRRLSFNTSEDMVLVWWKCSRDEVYPWSPIVRDVDRANVHIYSVNTTKLDLVCYFRTEFDPIKVFFSQRQPNTIHTIQQKTSSKGEVTLEWSILELVCNQIETSYVLSLLLPTHPCVVSLGPNEEKIFIACIDGSLIIADCDNNISDYVKATFIPSLAVWHPDDCLILISNEKGQMQWYDTSLSPIKSQLTSEDSSPSTILDLSIYFKYQPTLLNIIWNRTSNNNTDETNSHYDDFLLLQFERGPIAVVRLVSRGRKYKLTSDVIANQYLAAGSVELAVNLLLTIDWDKNGDIALSTLQTIVTYLIRLPLNPYRENLLEKALGSYFNPRKPLSEAVDDEFSDSVHDLARRFFHHLLRYQVIEKAFRLAIDLEEYDLFMDLHNYSKAIGNNDMALAALEKAEEIMFPASPESSSCCCSSDCSSCCSEESSVEAGISKTRIGTPPLPIVNSLPPQPAPRHSKVKFSPNVTTHVATSVQEISSQFSLQNEISPNAVGLPPPNHKILSNNSSSARLLINNSVGAQEDKGKIKVVHFGLV